MQQTIGRARGADAVSNVLWRPDAESENAPRPPLMEEPAAAFDQIERRLQLMTGRRRDAPSPPSRLSTPDAAAAAAVAACGRSAAIDDPTASFEKPFKHSRTPFKPGKSNKTP